MLKLSVCTVSHYRFGTYSAPQHIKQSSCTTYQNQQQCNQKNCIFHSLFTHTPHSRWTFWWTFLWMLSGSMHLFRTCRPSLLTCRCFTFLLFCHLVNCFSSDFFIVCAALKSDIQYHTHPDIKTDQWRKSITDKWKRCTGIWRDSRSHTYIQEALQRYDTCHTTTYDLSGQVFCPQAHPDTFHRNRQ